MKIVPMTKVPMIAKCHFKQFTILLKFVATFFQVIFEISCTFYKFCHWAVKSIPKYSRRITSNQTAEKDRTRDMIC